MPGEAAIEIKGMRELSRAFTLVGPAARRELRATFKEAAEPVKRDAESLALANISHVGDKWSKMRVGVTQRVVYVAPKQRGRRARGGTISDRRRHADVFFAAKLMGQAMEPALTRNATEIEHRAEVALDHIADKFNHGGSI